MGFWSSIGDALSSAGHFIGNTVHEGLDDIENVGKSALGYMNDAKDKTFSTAGHLIDGAENLGGQVVSGAEHIVEKGESIISTPLLIIAGGLALFLLSPNFSKAVDVGGRVGEQALKNPAIMGI